MADPRAAGPDDGPPTEAVPAAALVGRRAARAGAQGGKLPLRHRVLPRSLLGLTAFILSFAIGAGLSGVVLFSYYQYKLNQTDDRVNALVSGYKKAFADAETALASQTADDKAQISAAVGPIQALESSPQQLAKLTRQLAPSVFFVHTLDSSGQPSVGTAFVVQSGPTQSLLLTSYATVKAATTNPGPPVYVQQGTGTSTAVTVRSWDASTDLALIVLPRGGLPAVPVAPASAAPTVGERVFAVSGQGSAGASLSQGVVTDVASNGVSHDAPLGAAFPGGPLVDADGQAIAVGSRTYAPLGFTSDGVWFAPFVQAACAKVLDCPGGVIPTSS